MGHKPETLLLAYHYIKGNKGALTSAATVDLETYNNFDAEQKILYVKSFTFPDKISLKDFLTMSSLLGHESINVAYILGVQV